MDHPQPRTAREEQLEGLFKEFVEMGSTRSYGKLARKHGIEAMELMRHARGFLWAQRLNAAQIQHNETTQPAVDVSDDAGAQQINTLHLTRLKLLQQKAMTYLETCTFDKPETALRMLVDTMKLQRDIMGLSKDKTDDLQSILLGKLKEMADTQPDTPSDEPEFPFDPDFTPEPLTTDGPQDDSAPPSGGDHAE